MSDYIPKWNRELGIFIKVEPVIILEGNVLDLYQFPVDGSVPKGTILRLSGYLHYFLKDSGYQNIIFYDSIRGFYNDIEDGYVDNYAKLIQSHVEKDNTIKAVFKSVRGDGASAMARDALKQSAQSVAICMNFASRYISNPDRIDQGEVDSFTLLEQASLEAMDVITENGPLKNVLILIVNKVNDIPAWFYLQNPNVKTIRVADPSKEEREAMVKGPGFPGFFASEIYKKEAPYFTDHSAELEKVQDKFVALTDGFSFTELKGLRKLCKNEKLHIKDMCDAIDLYKYGIRENPWKMIDREVIANAEKTFEKRVKGQKYAVTKTVDVIKRAITGMAGLQGSSHTRPKGVLFFAGPTGTGKTETAKTLAELLFGDESCCIRFDMSEYSQSHSDQKLLGAPPGYIGYEAGGQLTNAVRRNPFSILLFDEIEKAHPSILDKFLQILEDGRMTDGQGNTVYFSETVIIFTSNLGIYTTNRLTGEREANVNSDMSYSEVSKNVREAIDNYFKIDLGRPEILNRIGENIVVFDYIRPDVAEQILDYQLAKIIGNVDAERHISITLSETARKVILDEALNNLDNGGRGIGNVVENLFINPLSRFLFDENISDNTNILVNDIDANALPPTLECTVS